MDLRQFQVRGGIGEYLMKSTTHGSLDKQNNVDVWTISTSSGTSSKSFTDIETESSDLEVYQAHASSSCSGYADRQTLDKDESGRSTDSIKQINGSIVLSLMKAKLWYKFLELGTEMIINKAGRRMFPYFEFSLRGIDPVGLYDIIFDIIPASSQSFTFLTNHWVPIGKKEEEFKNHSFKHPDSPQFGASWMTQNISFDKVKLSNKPNASAGIFTLHTHQKYLVRISIVKHERDDELSVVELPIRATTFIAVTAYNNRDVTKLKINSNPYSKGFRFPMKRMRNQSFGKQNTENSASDKERKMGSNIISYPEHKDLRFSEVPLDLSLQKSTRSLFESVRIVLKKMMKVVKNCNMDDGDNDNNEKQMAKLEPLKSFHTGRPFHL